MKTIDLTIHLDDLDVQELLADWRWLVPSDYHPIQMNKFGDWFFVAPDGQVIMLDLLDGDLTPIAGTVNEYNQLKKQPDYQTEWFLDGFVFRCESQGLRLATRQCYGWRIHPIIGGDIKVENIQVFDLSVYQSLMGQILPQWKALKPGDSIPKIEIAESRTKSCSARRIATRED